MMRPSVQGVDPPVCCVLDVTVTYARDSFVDCQAGPFVLSRGGPDILAPVLHCHVVLQPAPFHILKQELTEGCCLFAIARDEF